ncbi:MAG: MBOAT family protein [Phycisphaeraceae bacterium]|nr:MBOAT family protein [Phycisphaeraceae bacterium]
MLFNSIDFAIFLPIVFLLHWFVLSKDLRGQNLLLLGASYTFYGWWDWRFLFLLATSSLVDFIIGIYLGKTNQPFKRKLLLLASICVNLGFLAGFKYFNFFVENFAAAFTLLGHPIENSITLNIILPVGISFYTFQTLSYSIDVYRRKLEPTKNLIAFMAFVSFFPQLVAGPIERATHLLPQFSQQRRFEYHAAVDGMRQILWGLFKKVVIADNCAIYVNDIFAHHTTYTGSTLLLGSIFFAFQIYADFSGYSDIAIGTSKLFGINLKRNFANPYFSRDMAEFWRRWHISLSTWFRDYVYIPLGGSRGSPWTSVRHIFIIFIVSGFWHGANWTFIVWGALNAIYFLPLLLLKRNRIHTGHIVAQGNWFPSVSETVQMSTTFLLTVLAWVFFRAESVTQALSILRRIFSPSLFTQPNVLPIRLLVFIGTLVTIEWVQREKQHALQLDSVVLPRGARWLVYYTLILVVYVYGGSQQSFIYFQF